MKFRVFNDNIYHTSLENRGFKFISSVFLGKISRKFIIVDIFLKIFHLYCKTTVQLWTLQSRLRVDYFLLKKCIKQLTETIYIIQSLNFQLGWDLNPGTQDCESKVLPVCHRGH